MVIVSRQAIREFITRYPLSASAFNDWYDKTSAADWNNLSTLRKTFNSCDAIGNDRYVFDIGRNKFKLISMIFFKKRTLFIRRVLTHQEYSDLSKRGGLKTL